ncbi:hypothetical protein GCM10008018_56690 [Paenibacillus marchantiophytorum]|uniref:Uncharacterized protein n=1 Tax=Paenibacillus marchantiophytorum TaxID=1619310 RepID=A0ABQ1F8G8_9BACL|nr:hypothetical protein GCM10008018_56690 [Paenibacillus marchantiophytorum]
MKLRFANESEFLNMYERGVTPAASRGRKGTTMRYFSQKCHFREVEGTTVRYYAVSWKYQCFLWK